ncbi:MAG: hypothetical protein K6T86_16560 [Pirellulales bacterium]|nr:hypothetical protein [Pirellulales bacterium]
MSLLLATLLMLPIAGAQAAPGGEATASEADGGAIVGRLEGAAGAVSVAAIDRRAGRRYQAVVGEKGVFRVSGLPANAGYDLIIDYQQARLEGVDLHVPPSDYEEEQPLTDEDRQELRERMQRLNRFEDVLEFLAIEGNIQHAAVLVNKLRTRPFFGSKPGEVVWRAEIWHFERPEDHWLKSSDELFVLLYRERMTRAAYDKQAVTFDPRLGGLRPTDAEPVIDLGTIVLPPPQAGIRLAAEQTMQENEESTP